MTNDEMRLAATKLRLHLKSDPNLSAKVASAIADASEAIGMKLSPEFFDRLVVVHESELDTPFSVTTLPVGSQCGLA
jgi:hypothetical protein